MPSRYKIAFFIRQDGEYPVESYLFDEKNGTDWILLIAVMQQLAQVGRALLETNAAKDLTGYRPICELRKNRHRIFYAEEQGQNRFIMLSAFLKRSEKTPIEELERARAYWQEYQAYKKVKELDIPLDHDLANL